MKASLRFLSYFVTTLLFVGIVALAPKIVDDSLADQAAKSDIAEINHIMYGIFSVNAWKGRISQIILGEIQKIDLKKTSVQLKATIEAQLSAVIDKLNEQVREANKSSLGGRLKQILINLVVDVETIKKGVPKYADAVIGEFTKPETEKMLKDMASKQVRTYLQRTFVEQNMEKVERVLDRTGEKTIEGATAKLRAEIEARREELARYIGCLIGLAVLLLAWISLPANRSRYNFTVFCAALMVMLGIGVSIPMIDLEAKISEMSFVLLGTKIAFYDQMLYFQSKSVLNVFTLMIEHNDIKMKGVGVLLVLFSIILPVLKIFSSLIYLFAPRTRSNRVLNAFAFKTGKWSMADVMVIAILMAYIGFNGIVEVQFDKMKAVVPKDITFLTTNGTSLQLGFYIFLTYVLLALVFSTLLKAVGKKHQSALAKANA